MAKIFGQLIKAQFENVAATPALGITGRAVVNTVTNKVFFDNGATVMEAVGASEAQTLTNKIIAGGSNTITGLLHGTQVDNPSSGVHGVVGSVVGTTDAQALTNKTIVAGSNTITGLLHGTQVDNPSSGVHGVTGSVVGTTDSQALTNKTIVAGSNTITGLLHGTQVDNPTSGVHGVSGSVVGTTDAQALTNKTIVAGSNTITGLLHGTQVDNPSSGIHGVTGSVVGTSDTQVITNKNIDGGTASNTSRITLPKNSFANLTALTRKEATLVYDQTNSRVMYDDGSALQAVGSGTGSSSVNLISNSDALTDTSGYATYKDAAGTSPVDATGGSPTTVTLSRTTTAGEVLVGTGSFKLAKSAANGQGEGVSYDFTVPRAFAATPMSFTFNYQTTANFSYANNDLVVYLYDVTAGSLIQPVPFQLDGSGKAVIQFQTSSNASTSYRFAFHIATVNATAWDFIFDNVIIYPLMISTGGADLVEASYNSVTAGVSITSTTVIPFTTRVFDISPTGTAYNSSSGVFTAPISGYFKVFAGARVTGTFASGNITQLIIRKNGSDAFAGQRRTAGGGSAEENLLVSGILFLNANETVDVTLVSTGTSPVTAASSTANFVTIERTPGPTNNLSDGRIVSMYYSNITNGTAVSSSTTIPYITKHHDTHSAYNTSTGFYTVPITGFYHVSFAGQFAGTFANPNQSALDIYIDSTRTVTSAVRAQAAITEVYANGAATIFVNAGQTISIQFSSAGTSPTTSGNNFTNYLTIDRLTGSAAILAAEKIAFSYRNVTNGTSVSSATTIPYTSKDFDSHDLYNTTSGIATIKAAGEYQCSWGIQISGTFVLNNLMNADLYKNGTRWLSPSVRMGGANTEQELNGAGLVRCIAGDTLEIKVSSQGTSPITNSNGFTNWFTLAKI